VDGQAVAEAEVEAYCDRLNELRAAGGQIKAVQVYTIARKPAEPTVAPLPDAELDRLAEFIRGRVPVPVETFYGVM
jgi:hypothetical protein